MTYNSSLTGDRNLWHLIEPNLLKVTSPSQYVGGEVNSIVKEGDSISVRIALAFPDTYNIGMSHWGLQVLYGAVNKRSDAVAERVFSPWTDMEQIMREQKIPLFSLETHSAVRTFDVLAFSLQYELVYTNVLNMLDLAGIPLKSTDRDESSPLIIAGGPAVFNPEPMADFIDIFVIGDGEEKISQIIDWIKESRSLPNKLNRNELIEYLVKNIPSLYAPSLYQVSYYPNHTLEKIMSLSGEVPSAIEKAVIDDLDKAFYPIAPIVPFGDAVHNRISLEIMRGCPHSCRFCISGVIKSPLRFRSVGNLVSLAEKLYQNTGYDEISLLSLSSSDYPDIDELILRLNSRFKSKRVGLSLPSLRVNEQLMKLPSIMNAVRKSGFTMAPEAGSDSLRNIIGKDIKDDDLFSGIRSAYQNGWRLVKLYFMIGLPGEKMDDIQAIADKIYTASKIGKEYFSCSGNINVTISPFVPKPHTPFQWLEMESLDELRNKQDVLKRLLKSKYVKVKFHQPERSYVESIFSRGDRSLGVLLLNAYKNGCKFDAWDEFFDFGKWQKAFADTKKTEGYEWFTPEFFANRKRQFNEVLPWDIISCGISKDYLLREAKSLPSYE